MLGAVGARPPATVTGTARGDSIQGLRVWDPPEFCLAFFCAMPPSAPLIASFLTGMHPLLTPLLLAVAAAVMSHLAACFTQLVKDRMLLSAEVMREYDQRFVYKRVFAPMVDRGVGTSDGESFRSRASLTASSYAPLECPMRHPPTASIVHRLALCPFPHLAHDATASHGSTTMSR